MKDALSTRLRWTGFVVILVLVLFGYTAYGINMFLWKDATDYGWRGMYDSGPDVVDEVFGLGYRDGAFFVTQQAEVTRITDRDGDGRADRFETLSDVWGFRHYHEFAFGSKPDKEGNIWVALCLSESYRSKVPFRGWCLKVTPDPISL